MAELIVGDLAWAKMKGYSVWPGKVVYPPTSLKPRKRHKYIFFFGTNNYAWVPEKNIFGYAENFEKFSTKNKTASFRRAVDAIVKFADEGTGFNSDSDQCEENSTHNIPEMTSQPISRPDSEVDRNDNTKNILEGTGFNSDSDQCQENFSHNIPEMTSHPIGHLDSEEKKKDNTRNIQEFLISSGTSSVPTVSHDDANEGVRETAKQRRERIHERLRQLREAREAELEHTRMLEKRSTLKQSKSVKRVSSNNKRGCKKKAKFEHKCIAKESKEMSSSEVELIEILNENPGNAGNEGSTELPVPITHIKIESDYELLDSDKDSDHTDLAAKPIILAAKPKHLGTVPPNVYFRSSIGTSIVASRKAAHAAAKIQKTSQQITEKASQETCAVQAFPQISALASSEKVDTLMTLQTTSQKEVLAESVEFHPKGLPSHVGPSENTLIPVVISKEKKEICEERKAELTCAITNSVFIIGFVGLSAIGKSIVKNLLRTNHKIHVHLPDRKGCKYFARLGARAFTTPSAIVETSNVTFLCVDNSDEAKRLINSDDGIHDGFTNCRERRRNFVNMSCMNHDTVAELEKEMRNKKVRYLQAEVIEGSETQAEKGRLTIICSGSQMLYNKCQSLFKAISKKRPPPLLGCNANAATTMEIIYGSLVGAVYVGLHEALTSVESFGLDKNKFVNILKDTAMFSSGIMDKATEMVSHGLTSVTGISVIEEKMKTALSLSNKKKRHMPALAAAHEIIKHSKYNVHSCQDATALIQCRD